MKKRFDWRPPGGGVAFLAGCFMFAGGFFLVIGGDSWYTRWACPFFLPIGLGLWLKHAWARWTTFAFFVLVALLTVTAMVQSGVSIRRLVQAVVIACSLAALWQWDVYPEDERLGDAMPFSDDGYDGTDEAN